MHLAQLVTATVNDMLNDLVDESDPNSIYSHLYSFLANNYFIYYPDIESYRRSQKPNARRKWLYYLIMVNALAVTLTSALLIINHEATVQTQLGIFLFALFDQQKVMFGLIFAFSLLTLLAKLLIYYFEITHRNSLFDYTDNMISGHPLYQLTRRNQLRIILLANFLYWVWLKFISNTVIFTICLGYPGYALIAWLFYGFDPSILNFVVSYLGVMVWLRQVFMVMLGIPTVICLLMRHMKLKLDEVIHRFQVCIDRQDRLGLLLQIDVYNRLSKVIDEVAVMINICVGLIYAITPVMTALIVELMVRDDDDFLWYVMVKWGAAVGLVGVFCTAYICNYLAASISKSNESIAKHIYPVIGHIASIMTVGHCDRDYSRDYSVFATVKLQNTKFILKLDAFVDRVNNDYLGFYCFNLFKFTKLSLYEYAYVLTTTYLLVNKFYR